MTCCRVSKVPGLKTGHVSRIALGFWQWLAKMAGERGHSKGEFSPAPSMMVLVPGICKTYLPLLWSDSGSRGPLYSATACPTCLAEEAHE